MKKLNTLILSAALLCPMWAGAQALNPSSTQTTVGALGKPMSFYAANNPMQITPFTAVPNPAVPSLVTVSQVFNFTVDFLVPNNDSSTFGIWGNANGFPLTGSAFFGGGSSPIYLTISLGGSGFNCTLNSTSLNGYCVGSASQGAVAFTSASPSPPSEPSLTAGSASYCGKLQMNEGANPNLNVTLTFSTQQTMLVTGSLIPQAPTFCMSGPVTSSNTLINIIANGVSCGNVMGDSTSLNTVVTIGPSGIESCTTN